MGDLSPAGFVDRSLAYRLAYRIELMRCWGCGTKWLAAIPDGVLTMECEGPTCSEQGSSTCEARGGSH